MLHLYIVHRAQDVKRARHICKVCQHYAIFLPNRMAAPSLDSPSLPCYI